MGAVKHRVARPITAYGALGDYNTFVPENRLLFRLALVQVQVFIEIGASTRDKAMRKGIGEVGWGFCDVAM